MKNRTIIKALFTILGCLFVLPMIAQDELPADFGDAVADNPDDAPISNYVWMGIITLLTVVYLIKRKYFKKA